MKKKITPILLLIFVLSFPAKSTAITIFSDDFSDGNTAGWTFHGANSGSWSGASGRLLHASPGHTSSAPEFATIDGIATPNQFTLEADVSITGSQFGNDWGHVGFAWGLTDLTLPFDSYNTSYLRTHQDRVTNWSVLNGAFLGEQFLNTPGAVNNVTYHLRIDVDSLARVMTTSVDSFSTTFSGADFDRINQNAGGAIGLISWGDNSTYDNVMLSTPGGAPVPEPSTILLLGSGLVGLVGFNYKRNKTTT